MGELAPKGWAIVLWPTLSTTATYMYHLLASQHALRANLCIRPQVISPDDDKIWMTSAPTFASSGGGYSALIRECASHFNRSVLQEGKGVMSDGRCWKRPAPDIVYERNYSWETTGWQGKWGQWDGSKTYIERNSTVYLWGKKLHLTKLYC